MSKGYLQISDLPSLSPPLLDPQLQKDINPPCQTNMSSEDAESFPFRKLIIPLPKPFCLVDIILKRANAFDPKIGIYFFPLLLWMREPGSGAKVEAQAKAQINAHTPGFPW